MASLVLRICVANPPYGSKVDTLYDAIEKKVTGAEAYRLDRSKVTAAAIELTLILQATSTIAAIADLLYHVWKDHKDKGQLYVVADPRNKIEIMISRTTTRKDLDEFQRRLIELVSSGRESEIYQETIDEMGRSRIWIKTK